MIFVSSCPARPTNGIALDVFVAARRLADEHQVGVGVADAEHDLLAPERVQLAARAVADVVADRDERRRPASARARSARRRRPAGHAGAGVGRPATARGGAASALDGRRPRAPPRRDRG